MRRCGWAALGLVVLAGCGRAGEVVATDGSTSMEKVIGILGEAFAEENDGVTVTYNPTGSSAGLQAVLAGRCDIGLSSRALTEEEQAQGLVGQVLAYDGLAVVVNPQNPVSDLTMEQLSAIYTGQITSWAAVGGADAPIVLIGREAGSGTREGFEEATGTRDSCPYRQELTATGDVLTAVSQNPYAIGYASLAAVQDSVKTVSVDGVFPGEDTVKSGAYPVRRPFLLVTGAGQTLSPAAQAFSDYALSARAAAWIQAAGAVAAQ
jgi:phosphate transport system substrate-binding protein